MREVPKAVSPMDSTICFTVKFLTVGFFVKISRRIWEVRTAGKAFAFLVPVTDLARLERSEGFFRDVRRLKPAGAKFSRLGMATA